MNNQNLSQVPDLMPSTSEAWLLPGHHTPRITQRFGHKRESSLSSIGSNGPASPYNPSTSHPHIAVTDSTGDGFHDMNDGNYSYHLGKPMMGGSLYGLNGPTSSAHNSPTPYAMAEGLPALSPAAQHAQLRSDRGGLAPAAELSVGGGSFTRSRPVSVASSVVGGDSPATPSLHDFEDDSRRRKNVLLNNSNAHNLPPKLDRSMTDIYSDELYNPHFGVPTTASPPQTMVMSSPGSDVFAQRLQAANNQRLSAAMHSPAPTIPRGRSPFRHDSPHYVTAGHEFPHHQMGMSQARVRSSQPMVDNMKAEHDGAEVRQQATPNTISPKDAVLEFNDSDDAASSMPLFPPQDPGFNLDTLTTTSQAFQPMTTTAPLQSGFTFSMPSGINMQLPQQYPFVSRPRSTPTFSRMNSAESINDGPVERPARTTADGGTYTCTYHGCTRRFETPALLQKHKREGHRQANALNSIRASPGLTSSMLNSQAGPHKCERINPSTGKPCNTIFSRPYDLTRHEDTIHNARKQKVRCNLCTEEKTFSRADALTRHYRVCHPDVEFPGKHRRRGGQL